MNKSYTHAAAPLLPIFWAGIVIGVSFIATPAKFLAPSLGIRTALDVGRWTFDVFNNVEVLLAVAILLITLFRRNGLFSYLMTGVLLVIVAVQKFALIPALDSRVDAIIAGFGVAPSNLHVIYVATEIAKIIALVVLGMRWAADDTAGNGQSHHLGRFSRRIL